jgi:BMFP domain-containing protein YqiC
MAGAIKPTSVEGYLIRLYDTCEHLTAKMTAVEAKMDGMVAEDRMAQRVLDQRINTLESRMAQAESQSIGAKDVKSSLTPYVIAFVSAMFAAIGYVILHFVGIK